METRRGGKRASLAAPERAAKRARVSSPSSGDDLGSSPGIESQREPTIRFNPKNKFGLTKTEADLDLAAILGTKSQKTWEGKRAVQEDWETQRAVQDARKTAAGVRRARAAGKEWTRRYLAEVDADNRQANEERKELLLPPAVPRSDSKWRQFTTASFIVDRDPDVVKRDEESVRLEHPPEEVTLYEGAREAIKEEMATIKDPLGERQGHYREVLALLECVEYAFESRPGTRDGRDAVAIARKRLPFPLCEAAFLDKYVQPQFSLERPEENEAVAMRIIEEVDAADSRWEQLLTDSKAAWLQAQAQKDHDWLYSPIGAYSMCEAAYERLEEKVAEVRLKHKSCMESRYATVMALVRAKCRMEYQLVTEPIPTTILPEPVSPRKGRAWATMASLEDKLGILLQKLKQEAAAGATGGLHEVDLETAWDATRD
ncbi:hypothetical protein H2200_012938 [Cladophialophora chaetospira]|uniref:Uncharacterized protein n=1 Tax=Cladophialophora chaetospira TaxID=386627 RepID=A0AA38WX42_9EURO|nr:hypothetical protein H2200_012938 [Cladophialophora chaetospira]